MVKKFFLGIGATILIGVFVYFGIKSFQANNESQLQTRSLLNAQQNEIQNLKTQIAKIENSSSTNSSSSVKQSPPRIFIIKPTNNSNAIITTSDLSPYLSGVVRITCYNAGGDVEGSGSLWRWNFGSGSAVITNEHVINNSGDYADTFISDSQGAVVPYHIPNACSVDFQLGNEGFYYIDINLQNQANQGADAAAVPLYFDQGYYDAFMRISSPAVQQLLAKNYVPIKDLNYSIGNLRRCPSNISVGSPVAVVGYPAFGYIPFTIHSSSSGDLPGADQPHSIVTTGIISSVVPNDPNTATHLDFPDYFVSAKMDSGDSGGIAFSKDTRGLCVLGIPTWLSTGNYESEGLVQNINNLFR